MHRSPSRSALSRRSLLTAAAGSAALGLSGCSMLAQARQGGSSLAGFIQKQMDYFFYVASHMAVQRSLQRFGYQLQTTNAEGDSYTQFQHAQSMLVKQPAFLIVDLVDSWAMGQAFAKAEQLGVPAAAIDTPLQSGRVALQTRVDDFQCGVMAAQRTAELLTRRYGKPRGTVLNVYGSLQSYGWRRRKEGWDAVMRRYPDIVALSRPSEGEENTARSVTQQVLAQYPDLDAAHGPSDSLTRGVITALRAADRIASPEDPKHVILTSIDGEPQSLRWLRAGIMDAAVSQDPVAFGEIAVELLHEYSARGRPIPEMTYSRPDRYFWGETRIVSDEHGPLCVVPPFYVDESNLDDPRLWGNVVEQQWGLIQQ